jgi:hypothetical protein
MKIAARFAKVIGWKSQTEYLKEAWAIVKFEEELEWHRYCAIKFKRNDIHGEDQYVIELAEGDDPHSWVENEVDNWNDYCRAFEKQDLKKLVNYAWDWEIYL